MARANSFELLNTVIEKGGSEIFSKWRNNRSKFGILQFDILVSETTFLRFESAKTAELLSAFLELINPVVASTVELARTELTWAPRCSALLARDDFEIPRLIETAVEVKICDSRVLRSTTRDQRAYCVSGRCRSMLPICHTWNISMQLRSYIAVLCAVISWLPLQDVKGAQRVSASDVASCDWYLNLFITSSQGT